MKFEFATATHILFGPGSIHKVASHTGALGKRAFVVTGRDPDRAGPLLSILAKQGIECVTFSVTREPTDSIISEGIHRARDAKSTSVIGVGGGSVLDTGKVIAALLTNSGEILDYCEVIGNGHTLTNPSAPYIAIPTTAGTGTEVTRNAVVKSSAHQVKVSIRSPLLLPRCACVDPELTYTMPPAVTASTGLDALTQLMEAFVSQSANPLTDGICREGLQRAARSLARAYQDGMDTEAREDMAVASLFGGLALANAKLGAVHGFAGVVGGMFDAPHGVICARILPYVMETNVHALQSRMQQSNGIARYQEVARILTNNSNADVEEGINWIYKLCEDLHLPALREYGLYEDDFVIIIEKSKNASSMKGNPVTLTDDELNAILRKACTCSPE